MRRRQYAPKPAQDTSVLSSEKLLQTRPFQPEINNNQQAPQLQEEAGALAGSFDLTQRLSSFDPQPISTLSQPLQAKLTIGEPNDKYEQEADRVAHDVVQRIHEADDANNGYHPLGQLGKHADAVRRKAILQRETIPQEDDELQMKPLETLQREVLEEDDELQMKPLVQRKEVEGSTASVEVEKEINSARGGGRSLTPTLQTQMGQAMDADFSGVRVHTDARADVLNRSVGARAFTTGQDLFFKGGEYQPENRGGQELIAHELTHVVQQMQGQVRSTVQGKEVPIRNGEQLEYKANVMGAQALQMSRSKKNALEIPISSLNAQGVLQLKGGKANGSWSNSSFSLKSGDVIEYDLEGSGFKSKITITHLNGKALTPNVFLDGLNAINVQKVLEDYDGPVVVDDKLSPKGKSGEQMLVEAREKNIVKGGNPDEEGGTVNSYFSKPKAISISKDGDIVVETELHTLNYWDRVSWKCRVGGPKGPSIVLPENKSWWSNPAWNPSEMSRYTFKEDFLGLTGEGVAKGGVKRTIRTTIPGSEVKKIFGEDLANDLKESSIICLGMEVFYGGAGPTTATKTEFEQAYTSNVKTAHQYGLGATSSPESYGYVDLSGLGLKQGEWLTDEEVWEMDIPDNPSPNIRLPFPEDYAKKELIAPLEPESGMKIATRIENEATLKVSSLATLKDIIRYLQGLAENSKEVTGIMSDDETLDQFNWSVTATEDNSMVFTDVYLDDLKHTALRAGVGIRKRSSETATKLNVKTGTGYQVGELDKENQETSVKSDIYRRHEIGYDLKPDAKISDIGVFLAAGVAEKDPWNRGGEQANLALPKGEAIDFANLQGTMVLQGDRKKFNLKAVHKESGGAINIEISCDHTVGRTFEDYEKIQQPEDLFTDLTGKYEQAFNIEMELEHLGAGAPKEETEKAHSLPSTKSSTETEPLSPSSEPPTKRPPPGHPGRLYMRDDSANPKFNTRSFEVFAKAHDRMIKAMQINLKDSSELHEDKQKLETLFAALFPKDSKAYGSAPERGAKKLSPEKMVHPDVPSPEKRIAELIPGYKLIDVSGKGLNCSIRALMLSSGHEIDEEAVALIRSHLIEEAKVEPNSFLGLGQLEREALLLITKMDASYLKERTVIVLYDHHGVLEPITVREGSGEPVYIYLRGYHYQAIVKE